MITTTTHISARISPADRNNIITSINDIREKLPFLIDLSAGDRKTIAKLGSRGMPFVRKAVEIAVQIPQMLPAAFDLDEMRKDANLFEDLSAILFALDRLRKQLADTAMVAGGEAYAAARSVYSYASAAGATQETATMDLSKHYARRGHPRAPSSQPPVQPQQPSVTTQS